MRAHELSISFRNLASAFAIKTRKDIVSRRVSERLAGVDFLTCSWEHSESIGYVEGPLDNHHLLASSMESEVWIIMGELIGVFLEA